MLIHAIKNSAECIAIADKDYKITFVNYSFCKTYGFEEDEIIGQPISIIHSENNLPEESHSVLSSITGKEMWTGEVLNKRKDGNDFPVQLSLAPLLTDKGELVAVVGVIRDITERKQAEAEIRKTNTQLIRINAEKDKFFSIIAHDLRSPLSGFLGLTEVMVEDAQIFSQPEFTDFSRVLNESAKKLSLLLENLLEWALMQKDSISYIPKELLLSIIVSENIEQINQRAIQKGITIQSEVPENQKVIADERMINSILRNLLSNAVKFTGKDGKVTIKSKAISNDMIEISVNDTGIGISDINVVKLFKIDEKVSSLGTDGEPSTGLGLLLCKEIGRAHV